MSNLALTLGFLVLAAVAAPDAAADLQSLGWLTGCWTMSAGASVVEEHWTAPAGGTLIGMGRTIRDGKTTETEFLQIHEVDGRLAYEAKPSGQAEASFPLLTIGPASVVFENRSHDFPQRILYRRNADGRVTARIEGVLKGKLQAVDFPYSRCR